MALTRAERRGTGRQLDRDTSGQTAAVSSASSVERLGSGPSWNPRVGDQSLFNDLDGQASYRRIPTPVRPVCHRAIELGAVLLGKRTRQCQSLHARHRGRKGSLLAPDGPDDPRELIRDGDGGNVVAAPLLRL